MATPWDLPQFGLQQQQNLPTPVNYQPDAEAFAQLMSNLGGWSNSTTAPSATTPAPLPDPGVNPPTEGSTAEDGTVIPPANFQPTTPAGPFGSFGLPTNGQDPNSWDFWSQSESELTPLTNFLSIMSPYLSQLQNQYTDQRDFVEGQNRWNTENQWGEYLDLWNQGLQERQQGVAENDRSIALAQWLESFQRQGQNDQFSQAMALQNAQEQARANNLNAYGRSIPANARFSSSWG